MDHKIKHIVVALDFSEYTRPILDCAVDIARRTRAGITVLHIINKKAVDFVKRQFETDYLEYFPYKEYVAREKKRAVLKLEAMVKDCRVDDVFLKIRVEDGIPSVEILKFLNKEEADFVVIGQKGDSNLPQFMSGAVSEKVFRYSPVPVLSVRSPPGG
ncbi:MAG: universal stress protein [Desulfobacula sp.]|jgi:nucleotide-binding universal stress UspA family protein